MSVRFSALATLFVGDLQRDRVVPASGYTSALTSLTAAAMAFLVVFALALSLASYRLAQDWSKALEQSATLELTIYVSANSTNIRKSRTMEVGPVTHFANPSIIEFNPVKTLRLKMISHSRIRIR